MRGREVLVRYHAREGWGFGVSRHHKDFVKYGNEGAFGRKYKGKNRGVTR